MLSRNFVLLFIIFLEGYVVLSAEILAIRSTMPFVGSGTDTMSIIIAAVLMPLAFGYYAGGRFKSRYETGAEPETPRRRLLRNFMISAIFLTAGLSYVTLDIFFKLMFQLSGTSNRLILITIYSAVFLVLPVFLLGQTIPLVSNFFSKNKLPEVTGRILFFSTLGSFMGAVFGTLVLMTYLGVHNTVTITIACLAALTFMLAKKYNRKEVMSVALCLAFSLAANSAVFMRNQGIVANNRYNLVAIKETEEGRVLVINNNYSSLINEEGKKFPYVEFVEKNYLEPVLPRNGIAQSPPKDILVVGAGGFSFGFEDDFNNYDYIDIDKQLKSVAEEFFLKEKLGENKSFHAVPIRGYLASSHKQYDLIFLDAYYGYFTLPEHLVTREFFTRVKEALKPGGILIANFVVNPNFGDRLSVRVDNTFRSVFPYYTRQIIGEHSGWVEDPRYQANVMYVYHHGTDGDNTVYTDDKNTVFLDRER